MSRIQELDSVSFDDVAVDFTWDEWQDLTTEQRNLYWDVMLENYSSFVFLGYCMTKPELIFKLENGFGPWKVAKQSVWNLPGGKSSTCKECGKVFYINSEFMQHQFIHKGWKMSCLKTPPWQAQTTTSPALVLHTTILKAYTNLAGGLKG